MSFRLIKKSTKSKARLGILTTSNGRVETPFFLPIATAGSVKSLSSEDINSLGAQIILSNTYHLFLQPGIDVIKKARGLHKFMNWKKPILTDSGGFQVFSLARIREITNKGVVFNSHINGKKHLLTPELSIKIQLALGSDIIMSFDDCPPHPSNKEYVKEACDRTANWAKKGKAVWKKSKSKSLLFGIVQGGIYKDLRIAHLKELVDVGFDGYALGGLAVGEPVEKMYKVLGWCEPYLPENKPRYLMGTGYPEQLVEAVKRGIDMFDCVIPTREARHGRLYIWNKNAKKTTTLSTVEGRNSNWYKVINITNAKYKNDFSSINDSNLKQYSKAYLRHLFVAKEPLALRLATINNLHFYLELMSEIRYAIRTGKI